MDRTPQIPRPAGKIPAELVLDWSKKLKYFIGKLAQKLLKKKLHYSFDVQRFHDNFKDGYTLKKISVNVAGFSKKIPGYCRGITRLM